MTKSLEVPPRFELGNGGFADLLGCTPAQDLEAQRGESTRGESPPDVTNHHSQERERRDLVARKHCPICGLPGVTSITHQADGTHRAPRRTQRRRGCAYCGSESHQTRTHDGYRKDGHRAVVKLTPLKLRRLGLAPEPLGIASSSWMVQP